jgi:hypothetical protein
MEAGFMPVGLLPTSPLLFARRQQCRQFLEIGAGIMCRVDFSMPLDGWATCLCEMQHGGLG